MNYTKLSILNQDAIKYAAMFTMLFNHISHVFLTRHSLLGTLFTNIGYFTAITMCYFLTEGYHYTKSKKQYGIRLFLFAFLSQLPFQLVLHSTRLNMLFTLFFCFLILLTIEHIGNPLLRVFIIICLILLCTISDWSWKAPLFTLLFTKLKGSKSQLLIAYAISWLVYLLYGLANTSLLFSFYSSMGILVSGIVILYFYNGERAKRGQLFPKWFFYLFYPTHLLLLFVIRQIVF